MRNDDFRIVVDWEGRRRAGTCMIARNELVGVGSVVLLEPSSAGRERRERRHAPFSESGSSAPTKLEVAIGPSAIAMIDMSMATSRLTGSRATLRSERWGSTRFIRKPPGKAC
jgi:hypothetical protein